VTIIDRILRRPDPPKATYGGPALVAYQQNSTLSIMSGDWHSRARAYLDTYRVGWFYKAGSRIAGDFANLDWTLSYEDAEGDNEEEITAAPGNVPWESLAPLEQFLRLSERPNPWQTGRQFKQQQMVRLDFTGRAMVYLENGEDGGLPTALIGVNPCRMWPSHNAKGELIGWVLDKDRQFGGVPFETDEIIAIEYPGTDEEPQGVVEAVYAQVALTKQIPQHTSDMLATGGRLAGMAWPKERSLSEDEFADAQRAWRNVTSDPNAARRLLLFPEPMEYAAGAASPEQIGIVDLSTLTRDEILTAFPIAPEMLMVPMATGLNSGQTQGAVEARYWSGTLHPRVETWEDAFQQQMVPRYENAVGRPLDFDIEEPDLDDAPALLEKAGALKALIDLGFDPKSAVSAVGLDHIEYTGPPEPEPVPEALAAAAEESTGLSISVRDSTPSDQTTTSQSLSKSSKGREDVVGLILPGFLPVVEQYLADQRDRMVARIADVYAPLQKAERKALPEEWWVPEDERVSLERSLNDIYVKLSREALTVVANQVDRTVMPSTVKRVTENVLRDAGDRIIEISETTRKAVTQALALGVERGYSVNQILYGVPNENFVGVNQLDVWEKWRAERIARTETAYAYNEAALFGYKEFNVNRVVASDGPGHECGVRNGQTYTIEEALGMGDHPNGTLDWTPLTN
jgi:phage portal protein BeeE